MPKKYEQDTWKEWPRDKSVSYSVSQGFLKISIPDEDLGSRQKGPVRLIGGSIDATVRQLCCEMGYEPGPDRG